ncbi:unnamed protein product (macronuclear) [Paramecium tetraurelia]|uniref:Uncharacterized protein n=1 Tax=Paramecium tetraurelia TaxID=5888 RepID=A0C2C4_PARTE|nr:uncharacterized protein GSPATT00034418001 [Paramecium tetraurelia]CAK64941.1 unnamed protein product [Paramecium tetraurelia]|eukprot:XP_001432338.1 hypothetical protein (macronuclear) [Paramecium tetraurelia strain d4-2]
MFFAKNRGRGITVGIHKRFFSKNISNLLPKVHELLECSLIKVTGELLENSILIIKKCTLKINNITDVSKNKSNTYHIWRYKSSNKLNVFHERCYSNIIILHQKDYCPNFAPVQKNINIFSAKTTLIKININYRISISRNKECHKITYQHLIQYLINGLKKQGTYEVLSDLWSKETADLILNFGANRLVPLKKSISKQQCKVQLQNGQKLDSYVKFRHSINLESQNDSQFNQTKIITLLFDIFKS